MTNERLVIATRNKGKMREFKRLFGCLPFDLLTLDDVGIDDDVEETGETFEDNAILKARGYALISGELTLADDSGLEVDALGGAPGVLSARYTGPDGTDKDNNRTLIRNLDATGSSSWTARYRVVLALCDPAGVNEATMSDLDLVEGECEGEIIRDPKGQNGFGYDPYFYVARFGRTMAELSAEEKDSVSHRGIAARKMTRVLEERLPH
ncbi:MAG: RdgB/HAM1 family non-canonical purine NTP pyrophosphatase [Gammaproteobacteria bacterium]|nr:RdgB/HAM1 family non-canonical purine NTP pyrophosphatase [Gammaproteobacteria bacterium]